MKNKHSTFNIQHLTIIALMLAACLIAGCAALQPGADPLVVNAERLETTAGATFDFVVNTDDADRGFWRTNAPAFHTFVEWLRTPVRQEGTNVIRRGPDMILQLNAAKQTYKANTGQSNLLLAAINVLSAASVQAQSWQTIIQTATPK